MFQFSDRTYKLLDFHIDTYLNPFIPPNFLSVLPKPISHWLGYRTTARKEPPTVIQWILCFLATVAAICTVGAVYNYAPGIEQWHPPTIVASLGASAVLYYNAVASPLGQPRNSIVGHTLSAIVGVGIAKLFQLDPVFFSQYDWVAAAVACACASVVMSMTNAVHPPGGATAILATSDKTILALGWMFPPIILLASVLMIAIAMLFNNILRRYPTFWWTPAECGSKLPLRRNKKAEEKKPNEPATSPEKASLDTSPDSDLEKGRRDTSPNSDLEKGGRTLSPQTSNSSGDWEGMMDSQRTLRDTPNPGQEIWQRDGLDAIHIAPHRVTMPKNVTLSAFEADVLCQLMMRLQQLE